jgi:plastocyanin
MRLFAREKQNRGVHASLNKKKKTHMKHIVPAIALATVLTLGSWAPLSAEEEKEETLSASSVPAAVQKTAEAEAKGGTIVRWEKEGSNYEAVIENGKKQTGVEITLVGKVVNRHDESKEHKEKGE